MMIREKNDNYDNFNDSNGVMALLNTMFSSSSSSYQSSSSLSLSQQLLDDALGKCFLYFTTIFSKWQLQFSRRTSTATLKHHRRSKGRKKSCLNFFMKARDSFTYRRKIILQENQRCVCVKHKLLFFEIFFDFVEKFTSICKIL